MTHHEQQQPEPGHQVVVNPIQLQKYLKGIDYPTDKQTLIETAQRNGADDQVMQSLDRLPDVNYNSPNDVSEQIGKFR